MQHPRGEAVVLLGLVAVGCMSSGSGPSSAPAASSPAQSSNLHAAAPVPGAAPDRATVPSSGMTAATLPARPRPMGDAPPGTAMTPWTRLRCDDGRRLAIRFPMGPGMETANAQVMIDADPAILSYRNRMAASGIQYGGPPGYTIVQWHNQWWYRDEASEKPRDIHCQAVK